MHAPNDDLTPAALAAYAELCRPFARAAFARSHEEPEGPSSRTVVYAERDGNPHVFAVGGSDRAADYLETITPRVVAALVAEVLRLQADAARIDWLSAQTVWLNPAWEGDDYSTDLHWWSCNDDARAQFRAALDRLQGEGDGPEPVHHCVGHCGQRVSGADLICASCEVPQ